MKKSPPTLDRGKVACICIAGNIIGRESKNGGNGSGWQEELAYTLTGIDRHAVFKCHGQDDSYNGPLDASPTISKKFGTGGNNVPLVMATGQRDAEVLEDMCPTLSCNHDQPIIAHTLKPNTGLSHREDSDTLIVQPLNALRLVRRLTPLECDRLQGYPDNWTDIGPWADTKGKLHKESSDTARYQGEGNSIAIPVFTYVMEKVSVYLPHGSKLGSLFDGIGGFPLIWERIHGKNTAQWASEIEEFPIAVTKFHFGEE